MPDFTALVSPPKLVGPDMKPANGDIYVRSTNNVPKSGVIVIPFQAHGKISDGEFKALDGAPLMLVVTPEGVALEIFADIVQEGQNGRRDKFSINRTVSVPNQSTVTWDALVDVVPVGGGTDYEVPAWVSNLLADAVAAGTAATDAANLAIDALAEIDQKVADVPTPAQLDVTIGTAVAPKLDKEEAAKIYARVGRAVYGSRAVFDGDSITIGNVSSLGGAGQDRSGTWVQEFARRTFGAIDVVRIAAVAGNTSADRLAAFDTAVAAYSPDVIFLTIGTNDVGQSVPLATFLANLDVYLAKCETIGAALVVGAIWPTDAASPVGRGATTRLYNDALYQWAAVNGLDVIPWDLLADPITGGWPTGWSTDNIHPTLSDSLSQMGALAYQTLKTKLGPPSAVRRAVTIGDGLITNPFFTALGPILAAPAVSAGTPTTGTGTLPAGAYSYKVTNRTTWGESLPSAERLVTLSADGKIDLTFNTVAGTRQKRVYRKGPGDTNWRLLAKVGATATTYTDDGTIPAGTITAPTVDTSASPTGLVTTNATTFVHDIDTFGPLLRTEAGIRGNVMRLTRYESGTTDFADRFDVPVTAGDVLDFTCLARSSGATYAQVVLRFRSAVPADTGQIVVGRAIMSGAFGLLHVRATVPANSVNVRVSFEGDDTSDYLDVAELRLVKV